MQPLGPLQLRQLLLPPPAPWPQGLQAWLLVLLVLLLLVLLEPSQVLLVLLLVLLLLLLVAQAGLQAELRAQGVGGALVAPLGLQAPLGAPARWAVHQQSCLFSCL